MASKKDLELLKEIVRELTALNKVVKTKLRLFLKGKAMADVKDVLRELDKASLELLCELSLPEEDYEMCQAVKEVLEEKAEEEE